MENNNNLLKLVWDRVVHGNLKKDCNAIQMDLFSHHSNRSIIFIYASEVDKDSFSQTIIGIHPLYIIDMRKNPRFDFFGYSRKMAFKEFSSVGAKYTDRFGLIRQQGVDKTKILSDIENEYLNNHIQGPIAFILGNKDQDKEIDEGLVKKIQQCKQRWNLSVVP
jgi:hypothetical protein